MLGIRANETCRAERKSPLSRLDKGINLFTERFAKLPKDELDRIIEDEKFGPVAKIAAMNLKFNARVDAEIRSGKTPISHL